MRSYYKEADYNSEALEAATWVLPFVVDRYHPTSIVDVGCGQGDWLSVAKSLGVSTVCGLDGPHITDLHIDPSEFVVADLRKSLPALDNQFDLALCLEVAEHLPEDMAERFVDYLRGLAQTIVFSAAIPGQAGHGHLNNQWQMYWVEKFARRGYRASDWLRIQIWNESRIQSYYRQNVIAFEYHPDCPYSVFQNVVHPDFYAYMLQVHGIKGPGV